MIDMAPYTEAGLALKERNTGGDASSTAAVDGVSFIWSMHSDLKEV